MFGSFKNFLNKIEDKVIAIDARSRDALRPPESVQRAADQVQAAAHSAEDSVTRRLNEAVSASNTSLGVQASVPLALSLSEVRKKDTSTIAAGGDVLVDYQRAWRKLHSTNVRIFDAAKSVDAQVVKARQQCEHRAESIRLLDKECDRLPDLAALDGTMQLVCARISELESVLQAALAADNAERLEARRQYEIEVTSRYRESRLADLRRMEEEYQILAASTSLGVAATTNSSAVDSVNAPVGSQSPAAGQRRRSRAGSAKEEIEALAKVDLNVSSEDVAELDSFLGEPSSESTNVQSDTKESSGVDGASDAKKKEAGDEAAMKGGDGKGSEEEDRKE